MSDDILTTNDLKLEQEKLALEREMIALERERMEADRKQWALENNWQKKSASGLQVGMGVLGLAIAVALALGVVAGYRTGYRKAEKDIQTPRPIAWWVSKEFIAQLRQAQRSEAESALSHTNAVAPFDFFEGYKVSPPATVILRR